MSKGCRTIRPPKPAPLVVQEIYTKCILEKIMPLSAEQNKLLEGIAKSQTESEDRIQIIDERLKSDNNDPEVFQLIRNDRGQRQEREKKLSEGADKTADAPPTKQELEKHSFLSKILNEKLKLFYTNKYLYKTELKGLLILI